MSDPTQSRAERSSERANSLVLEQTPVVFIMLVGGLFLWVPTLVLLASVLLGFIGLWPTLRAFVFKPQLLPLVLPVLPFAILAGVVVLFSHRTSLAIFGLLIVAAFLAIHWAQGQIAKASEAVREAPGAFISSARWTLVFMVVIGFGALCVLDNANRTTDSGGVPLNTLFFRLVTGVSLAVAFIGAYAEYKVLWLFEDREIVEEKIAALLVEKGIPYTPRSRDELLRQHRDDVASTLLTDDRQRLAMQVKGAALGGLGAKILIFGTFGLLVATPGLNMFFGPFYLGKLKAENELAKFRDRLPNGNTTRGARVQ